MEIDQKLLSALTSLLPYLKKWWWWPWLAVMISSSLLIGSVMLYKAWPLTVSTFVSGYPVFWDYNKNVDLLVSTNLVVALVSSMVALVALLDRFSWPRRYQPKFDWKMIKIERWRIPRSLSTPTATVTTIGMVVLILGIKGTFHSLFTPPILPHDDYHFGEQLLPFRLWQEHGIRPYQDYTLAHGYIDLMPALVGKFFTNQETAAAVLIGQDIWVTAILVVTFFVLTAHANRWIAFFSALLLPPALLLTGYAIFFVALLFLFSEKNWLRRGRWLVMWLLSSAFLCGYAIGFGAPWVIATLPVAVWQLIALLAQHDFNLTLKNSFLLSGLILLIGVIATTLGSQIVYETTQTILALLRTLIENGQVNANSYGIPWRASLPQVSILSLLKESLRYSWMWFIGLIVSVWYGQYTNRTRTYPLIRGGWLTLTSCLYLLLMQPYTMGRIDTHALSRAGLISLLVWTVLNPMIFRLVPQQKIRWTGWGIGLLISLLLAWINVELLSSAGQPQVSSPLLERKLIDQAPFGKVYVNEDYWQQFQSFTALLAPTLSNSVSGQISYLDLTNRNAQYFYLNQPTLLESGSYYNLPHPKQQLRALTKLHHNPPDVIVIDNQAIIHDGQPLSLRSYPLYRWLLSQNAQLITNDSLTAIIALPSAPTESTTLVSRATSSQLTALQRAIGTTQLERLPIVWGRSLPNLLPQLSLVSTILPTQFTCVTGCQISTASEQAATLTITDREMSISLPNSTNLNPIDTNLATYDIVTPNQTMIRSQHSLGPLFFASTGPLAVPLDLQPQWFLQPHLENHTITFFDVTPGSELELGPIKLWQRKPL